jgi:hypothetical protein
MSMTHRLAHVFLLSSVLAGCDRGDASAVEVRMAVDEVVATGQADALEQDVLEISTSFTLGDAAAVARGKIEAFIASQSPCSTVTADGDGGLVIDFGGLGDACTYKGRTFAGVLEIRVEVGADATVVRHDFQGLTDGARTLDGTAEVTWTAASRRVVTDLALDREGGRTELAADRTQRWIDPDVGREGGIVVDGTRDWSSDRGDFALVIDGVELRPVDPVPQAGSYALTLPSGAQVGMSFARVDADTIEVRVDGARRDRVFLVTSAGDIDEQSE